MTALVVRGDALHLPLRDNSVDLIVTSPPYFALRSYSTGHEMEVGSEATPQAYLEALWAATREMQRVLKPTGSIWINLGDKYSGNATGGPLTVRSLERMTNRRVPDSPTRTPYASAVPEKSLMGLPWRYAIGCIDQLGLILRRDLIWDKPNGLPESVTDRPRSSHEFWFMFVKQPRYFAALDELRTPQQSLGRGRPWAGDVEGSVPTWGNVNGTQGLKGRRTTDQMNALNPLGKLPGSVWSIPSEPLRLPPWIDTQHYAAFPTEWPRRLILGFTPHLVCGVCGVGRFPVVDRRYDAQGRTTNGPAAYEPASHANHRRSDVPVRLVTEATIVGYACACTPFTDHPGTGEPSPRGDGWSSQNRHHNNPGGGIGNVPKVGPWREYHLDRWTPPPGHPATVLDPFGGTGTVAHVAHALGRHAITIDLSAAYCRLASDRTLARQRAAKVQGRVHLERQGSLL